jgi:hypothetical protein
MAKGCVYIPKTGKDAGKVFGSKESLAAHMNYTPALTDLMSKFEQSGGKADIDSVTKWLGDNGYLKKAETPKPTRKTRLAKLFETSEGEEAVPLIEQSLSESGIKVEVKDDADYNNDDRIKRSQGRGSEGMFVADDGTIILNRDKIKGEWGKTIVFHEGIHPVINIIRNTDPKRYKAIVDGLKAEAAKNNDVARVAADIAASEEYQKRGAESIEDETIVETMARVATGDVNIDKFDRTFREKFIEFMNDIAKVFGLRPILTNSPRVEVKRLADQINKMLNEGGKISDIVGEKNVKEFQNKITLDDTNSVFSNTSSQARFEIKFLEDSEDFTKLVEQGRVVHNASLDDINGETVVIHNPDNFSTGDIKFRGKDLVKGEGGVYFVLLYNDVWASGKKSSASQLASLINESLQKSTDGKGRLVLVKGDANKNLTSVKGAKALMRVMEILADDGLIPLSAFRTALNIAGKKYGINFNEESDAKSIHKDIQDKFMNVSNSSFERRGDFVRDVIDAIANQNVLSKEAIAEIAESIGAKRKMTTFSKASILDSVAYATSERMLRDIPNSHVYAVIETSSKVKPEFVGKHESYPWHIVTEDGSKPILHILKDRPFYNDAFVAAKSTEKVKEGEKFGDISRAGLGQRGMGLAKVETKPTGQPAQGILRGKRPNKAEIDKYLSEQDFFRSTSPFAWAVDPVSEETLKKSRIVENEGTYGVVTEDGDIKGVFNPNAAKQREGVPAKKNTLAGLIPKAINAGGIKLDNFDGRLTELYSKNGFRKVSSVPFNEEYAPEGWSKEKDGTPDVVSMVYDPDNKLDIEFKKFDDYGDMISYRDSFVDQARKEVDKKWGEKKVIALTKRDELGTKADREIAAYASKFLNKFGPYTKANVVQIMNMSAEEKIKLINDTFEAKFKNRKPEPGDPEDYFYEQAVKRRDEVLALVKKPTGQPSAVKRTPIKWEKSPEGKGDPSISSRNPVVTEAANKLKEGKITNEEYRATVSENSPILPITRFFEPATIDEIKNAFEVASKKESDAEKIDAPVADGTVVGLRLDIPSYKSNNTWVVSVHEGNTTGGKVISYTNVAKIKDVDFSVTPKGALAIAAGVAKTTIGRMYGKWENIPGANMEEKGENAKSMVNDIVNDPSYVQVGMNPFRHSYFYDRSSDIGRPIMSAEEVVQIGGLVYAKNPVYGNWTDEAFEVKGMLDASGKTVQFSAKIKRTPAQIRQATEDAVDAVDAAIADGMDPQQAIDQNISSQDWYGDLSATQKEQLNEILQDEFGAMASEPKLQNNAQRVADLWEKGGKEAKVEIKNILETDPELSYIYNNFPKITKQLEEQGLLTKTENCP